MAVSDAIGTQRQFTPQPQDPYAARLRPLRVPVGDYRGTTGDAAALANSLGLLGQAIINEGVAKEERRRTYADLSKHIINEATPEDMDKLRSIELLNKYHPEYNLSDNPYAVANVERAKGQMLTAKVKSEFENNGEYYNTSEEAVKAFEDNLREARDEYAGQSDNLYAFDDGVFATHVTDVINVANKQRQEKSQRLKQEALITATTKADKIVQSSLVLPLEETVENITMFAKENRLYNLTPKETFELYNGLVQGIAQYSGSGELLDRIKDIEVYSNLDKTYKLGDIVPFVDKTFVAGARTDYLNTQQMREYQKEIDGFTSLFELDEFYDSFPKDADPVGYEAVLRRRGEYEALIRKKMQKAEYNFKMQAMGTQALQYSQNNFDEQVDAYLAGKTYTATGGYVGNFTFTKVDSNGNLKTYSPSEEELTPFIERRVASIMQDDSIDDDMKVQTVCKMLSMKDTRFYANNMLDRAVNDLKTLSPSTVTKGADGNYVLPQQLNTAVFLRTHGGSGAELCFKDEGLGELDAFISMQNQIGYNQAIDLIMSHTDTLQDKAAMNAIRTDAKKQVFSLEAPTLDGGSATLSDIRDSVAQARAQQSYSYFVACGYDSEKAIEAVTESFKKNNYIYRGTLLPKSIFNGYTPELCKNGLDWYVEQYQKDNGLSEDDPAIVDWDNTNNRFIITAAGVPPKLISYDELRNQFEYATDEHLKKMKAQNINGNDVTKLKYMGNFMGVIPVVVPGG
ncbi:MAG: hypothetical protein DBY32_11250 [Phascolarctobacterium sp.]|nr:MAG: hypothetical protein DBY32_11250 [Phascolarctobacterium sp.]